MILLGCWHLLSLSVPWGMLMLLLCYFLNVLALTEATTQYRLAQSSLLLLKAVLGVLIIWRPCRGAHVVDTTPGLHDVGNIVLLVVLLLRVHILRSEFLILRHRVMLVGIYAESVADCSRRRKTSIRE